MTVHGKGGMFPCIGFVCDCLTKLIYSFNTVSVYVFVDVTRK